MNADPTKQTPAKRLVYGDGSVPCRECAVAFCATGDRFCRACGAPLQEDLVRIQPKQAAVSILLARIEAEQSGVPLQ